MEISNLSYYYNKFKYGEDIYRKLMKHSVNKILIVSTFYDAYILEQDGLLSEQLTDKYNKFNMLKFPEIVNVTNGEEALEQLSESKFDLIITMLRIGSIPPISLAKTIKEKYPTLPVFILLNVSSDIILVEKDYLTSPFIDEIFLWNGDSKLFLAMINYAEDMKNVEDDTINGLVRVILLVEDEIPYYSIFLPLLYSRILNQTQRLVNEEINEIKKRLKMRGRPKILIAHSYEQAIEIFEKYKDYLLCVISDVKYPYKGINDDNAGFKLINAIRKEKVDIPIVLQSSDIKNKERAKKLSSTFLHKQSKTLLKELRSFILTNLGFGDFIFRNKDGFAIAKASTMVDFENTLQNIPYESLLYHSERNHFSSWLIAHGEIEVAKGIKPMRFEDFSSVDELRTFLLNVFKTIRIQENRGKVINFNVANLKEKNEIVRIGSGSFGGKGRGIAFMNTLIASLDIDKKYNDVCIKIPHTAIIGTDEFDYFIEHNQLDSINVDEDDKDIKRHFINGELSESLINNLRTYIEEITHPIAVRSSSLLEDSQSQPFAGIYQTYMLPNNQNDAELRLNHLSCAIKLVYASVFLKKARDYIKSINYKTEEEKMAVVIQEIVGKQYDGYYYPHFAGVAESYNYYPILDMKHSDGIASLAIGLGKTVVEGNRNYKFCPKYPSLNFRLSDEFPKNSQTEIYTIDMNNNDFDLCSGEDITLNKIDLKLAEKHGTINHLVSVWNYRDNKITDGLAGTGPRIVTFANILKYNYFPLAEILQDILYINEKAMGVPVEIEFAVDLSYVSNEEKPTFYVLQTRPLGSNKSSISIDINDINKESLLLYTNKAMGNGKIDNISDLIIVNPDTFDSTKTIDIRQELSRINKIMNDNKKPYILIGPGRWGSRDKFLGIPVNWGDINMAKIIVEIGIEGFEIEPSQGTHFFHNLVSMNVGYFTVPYKSKTDFIDWEWIKAQKEADTKMKYLKHYTFNKPSIVLMDGRKDTAVIYK